MILACQRDARRVFTNHSEQVSHVSISLTVILKVGGDFLFGGGWSVWSMLSAGCLCRTYRLLRLIRGNDGCST